MTSSLPVIKSCTNCPSFTRAENTAGIFGSSTGSPMCSRFGKVLGRPKLDEVQQEKICQSVASSCRSYGDPRMNGIAHGKEQTQVAMPSNPVNVSEENSLATKVANCQMCKHFIGSDVVQKEMGWKSGLCAAKGKLILSSAARANANGCEYKVYGQNLRSTASMILFPEFEDEFSLASDPIKAFFKKKAEGLVDAKDYETDIPVSEEHAKRGIRAWRRIIDGEDKTRMVYLPIFDESSIPVEDIPKIPKMGDEEAPELYIDHGNLLYKITALWMELDETPAAWGEPGVGKTELYRHMAWLMGLPFIRISITRSSELDDLAGKSTYSPATGTSFKPGRVVTAWSSKAVLCLDEPNTGPPDVWQFLRPLTDNSKQLVLDMDEGQTIPRNEDCFLGLAMNPDWDPRNRGAEPIADADGSRLVHVWVPMPPVELEKEIIRSRVRRDGWEITDKQMKAIMDIAEELRKLSEQGELSVSWGIRSQVKVSRMLRWFGLVQAYRLASADYLEPSQQAIMLDVVRAHES